MKNNREYARIFEHHIKRLTKSKIKIENIIESNHAVICSFTIGANKYIAKLLEIKYINSLSKKRRKKQAISLLKNVKSYFSKLKRLQICLPQESNFFLQKNSDNKSILLEISSFEGLNLKTVFKKLSVKDQRKCIQELVKITRRVGNNSRIGIDMQLENFCVSKNNNEIILIDFCPPFINGNELWEKLVKGWNNKENSNILRNLFFSEFGPLRNLRWQLIKINPNLEEILIDILREIRWQNGILYIKNLKSKRFLEFYKNSDTEKMEHLLKSLTRKDIVDIREIIKILFPGYKDIQQYFRQDFKTRNKIFKNAKNFLYSHI